MLIKKECEDRFEKNKLTLRQIEARRENLKKILSASDTEWYDGDKIVSYLKCQGVQIQNIFDPVIAQKKFFTDNMVILSFTFGILLIIERQYMKMINL